MGNLLAEIYRDARPDVNKESRKISSLRPYPTTSGNRDHHSWCDLPGLIDAHSHIFLHPYNETLWNDQVLHEPLAYRTIAATLHSRETLLAGFTALRDLGTEGAGFGDVSVKRALDEGRIPGPCLFVATRAIVATANYGPGPGGFAPEFEPLTKGAQEASGTAEILRAVREQIGHGAD